MSGMAGIESTDLDQLSAFKNIPIKIYPVDVVQYTGKLQAFLASHLELRAEAQLKHNNYRVQLINERGLVCHGDSEESPEEAVSMAIERAERTWFSKGG